MLRISPLILWLVYCCPFALAERPTQVELAGTVRTSTGQLAQNCQLFMAAPSKNKWEWSVASEIVDQFDLPVISTTTDADGQYRLTIDLTEDPWLAPGEGIIVAQGIDGEVAYTNYKLSRARIDLPLDLQLRPSRAISLQILDDTGKPLPGVEVAPAKLTRWQLPKAISQQWVQTSDQDGRVAFNLLADITAVFVTGPSVGNQYLSIKEAFEQQSLKVAIRAARPRTFRCQAEGSDSTDLPGIRWTLISFQNTNDQIHLSWQVVTTEGARPADVGPIAGDAWMVLTDADTGHGWLPADRSTMEVGQQQSEVVLQVKRGLHVTGKVISVEDGQPLEGISLQSSLSLRNLVSRADGSYEMWLPMVSDGTYPLDALQLHFFPPAFYVRPKAEHAPGEARIATFELKRSSEAVGSVLGIGGEPLAGVQVQCESKQERFFQKDRFLTDRQGRFRLWSVADGTLVKLSVFDRRGVTTAPVEWTVHGQEAPTLQLVAPQPKTFRGRVVDEAGKPVAGAKIEVRRADVLVPGNFGGAVYDFRDALADQATGSSAKTIVTDSYGWFQSEPCLDWQHLFSPRVVHPGYREKIGWLRDATAVPESQETIDLGDLNLIAVDQDKPLTVSVRDAKGQGLPDARVLCLQGRAMAEQRITNKLGHASFGAKRRAGIVAVLHEQSVEFQAVSADQSKIDITLPSDAQSFKLPAALPLDQRRAMGNRLLTRFDRAQTLDFAQGSDGELASILAGLVFCQPESVGSLLAHHRTDLMKRDFLPYAVARLIQRDDSLLPTLIEFVPDDQRQWLLISATNHSVEPRMRQICLERCLLDARRFGDDNSVTTTGEVAQALIAMGKLPLAIDLVTETLESHRDDFMTTSGQSGKRGVARYFFPQLAIVDLPLAARLIEQHAYPDEVPALKTLALAYAVMAGQAEWQSGMQSLAIASLDEHVDLLIPGRFGLLPLPSEDFVRSLETQFSSARSRGLLQVLAAIKIPDLEPAARQQWLRRGAASLLSSQEVASQFYTDILAAHLQTHFQKLIKIDPLAARQIVFACMNDLVPYRDGQFFYLAERVGLVAESLATIDPPLGRILLEPFLADFTWYYQSRNQAEPLPLRSAALIDPLWAVDIAERWIDTDLRDDTPRQLQVLNSVLDGLAQEK